MTISNQSETSHPKTSRLEVMDFMRGLAILGMLVANVPWHVGNSMSRVFDPDFSSTFAWLLQYLIFDQRFLPLFCFLFGAGYCVLADKQANFADFRSQYIKRMLALFAIGAAHAYILWPGDILITYGVCGCLLLLFHRCSILQLICFGVLFKLIDLLFGEWPALYDNTLNALLFEWWVEYGDAPMPAAQAYAGSYADLFAYNAWRNQFLQWTALPYFRVWNALGLMLIGIALYKTGILQGLKSREYYLKMLKISLLIAIPLILYGIAARIGINSTLSAYLNFSAELPLKNLTFRTGCLAGSFTVLALIHLYLHRVPDLLKRLFCNVGRLALSNYLLQSVFFILLFHTFAVMSFDTLDHDDMLLLVIAMWGLHLLFSEIWLRHFKFGPIEQIYRLMFKGTKT